MSTIAKKLKLKNKKILNQKLKAKKSTQHKRCSITFSISQASYFKCKTILIGHNANLGNEAFS